MNGQHHSPWQIWSPGSRGETIAVVGVDYLTYYAAWNGGPWHRLGNGQASPSGTGIYFDTDLYDAQGLPLQGHYYVLGTDGHTRWCINFDTTQDAPTSDWYWKGCRAG
ncbi:hypothetical protein [Amycolatopsis sp. WGS_07]|uniref:hypothetical protein n=1 Tax=Amycolatopsis sp. WGS_07 TaxID=3076764 RepID=UPI003872EC84